MYSATVFNHATQPRNRHQLLDYNAHGHSSYPICGDSFELYLRLEGELIAEATFQARACAPVVAMGSLGTELLTGLTIQQARELNCFTLDEQLGGLPPVKRHAILLFLDALHQAISTQTI